MNTTVYIVIVREYDMFHKVGVYPSLDKAIKASDDILADGEYSNAEIITADMSEMVDAYGVTIWYES